jgi:hypothetical protein
MAGRTQATTPESLRSVNWIKGLIGHMHAPRYDNMLRQLFVTQVPKISDPLQVRFEPPATIGAASCRRR